MLSFEIFQLEDEEAKEELNALDEANPAGDLLKLQDKIPNDVSNKQVRQVKVSTYYFFLKYSLRPTSVVIIRHTKWVFFLVFYQAGVEPGLLG